MLESSKGSEMQATSDEGGWPPGVNSPLKKMLDLSKGV